MNSHTYVICLLLAICPLTGEAAAAAPPSDQPVIQAATSDSAVQVTAALYVLDLLKIDDAEQTAFVDIAFWLSWRDESLASPSEGFRFYRPTQIWVPNVQVLNSLSLRNRRVDVVEVDANGNATYRRRLVGTISIPRDLSDFPVDTHLLRISLVAGGMRRAAELMIDEQLTGQADNFSIADWDIGEGKAQLANFAAAGESFPMMVYEMEIRRKIGYYIWKVIIPLVMVVMMSWVVFWLDPKQTGPQIGIAATSILTLIAYRFSLGFLVPRLSYLTRLDLFIAGSSILVFAALAEALVTVSVAEERPALVRRIDITARWLAPLTFTLLLLKAFWL